MDMRKAFAAALCLFGLIYASGQVARTQQPVSISGGVTQIDDIGLYKVGWRYRSGVGGSMPDGWVGHFDDATGISCTPFGTQAGKSVFLIHPPWRGGTGVTDQTFRLKLPAATSIRLTFAVAMKQGEVGRGKSDGATFRVFVNGDKRYEHNQTTPDWAAASLDLTAFAGATVTLVFESDPGPNDNPSFDYALWGDRLLAVQGAPAAANKSVFTPRGRPLDTGYRQTSVSGVSPLAEVEQMAVLNFTVGSAPLDLTGGAAIRVRSDSGSGIESPRTAPAAARFWNLSWRAKESAPIRRTCMHDSASSRFIVE